MSGRSFYPYSTHHSSQSCSNDGRHSAHSSGHNQHWSHGGYSRQSRGNHHSHSSHHPPHPRSSNSSYAPFQFLFQQGDHGSRRHNDNQPHIADGYCPPPVYNHYFSDNRYAQQRANIPMPWNFGVFTQHPPNHLRGQPPPEYQRLPPPPPRASSVEHPGSNEDNASVSPLVQSSPNVKMTELPFFLEVSRLKQGQTKGCSPKVFTFTMTQPEEEYLKKESKNYQVQVRTCKPDSSQEQTDFFPPNMFLEINKMFCPIPGFESIPRGPARPIDITHLCKFSPDSNSVTVQYLGNLEVQVSLVKRRTAEDLLHTLQTRSPTDPDDTASKIREKLEANQGGDEIASMTQRCSLLCPLSKVRMSLPCRASTCHHIQCFDAGSYLQMNERNPKWLCPVCFQAAEFKNLHIDGYFKRILEQNTVCDTVNLTGNGNWEPLQEKEKKKKKKKKQPDQPSAAPELYTVKEVVEPSAQDSASLTQTIILDSDCEDFIPLEVSRTESTEKSVETIVLSEDESCGTPLAFRFEEVLCSTPKAPAGISRRRSVRNTMYAARTSANSPGVPVLSRARKSMRKRKTSIPSFIVSNSGEDDDAPTTPADNSKASAVTIGKQPALHTMVLRSSKRKKFC